MADEHYDPKAKEAAFRSVLQKLVVGSSLLLASLAVVIVLPVFPVPVSVALAIALGVIGYKVPLLGEMFMLYFVIFSVTYQLGLPLVLLLGVWIFFSLVSLQALRPGGIFAVSCGVIAAMLMTSPLYFLAVPIMLAAPMLRARGRVVGSTGAILVFVALYLLLLVHNAPVALPPQQTQPPVPLFEQTTFDLKPRLGDVDIDIVFSRLKESLLLKQAAADEYLNRLSIYWPEFQSGLRNGILVIVLVVFLGVSVAAAYGASAATRWIQRREVGTTVMPWISPIAAILGGEALFLILLLSMASSFSYKTGAVGGMVGGFIVSGIGLGALASVVEYWLRRRDLTVSYQEDFLTLRSAMDARIADAKERSGKILSVCRDIDIGAEEFAVRKARQDLALSFDEVDHMSLAVLQEKVGLFREEAQWLDQASAEMTVKVRQYYDDGRQKYLQYVAEFAKFGYSVSGPVLSLENQPLNSLESDRLLEAQAKLNELYRHSAEKALGYAEAVGELVKSELDPESVSIGLEIGRSYFEHQAYGDALDTLVAELGAFDRLVLQHSHLLVDRVADVRFELGNVLRDSVPKTVDGMGDPEGAEQYSALVSQFDRASYASSPRIILSELSHRIDYTVEMAAIALSAVSQLSRALSILEQAIESKSPSQYNWGKDVAVREETESIISGWEPSGWTSLANRLTRIELASVVIEKAALTVTRYGRVLEFFINYVNIEYLIEQAVEDKRQVFAVQLPVKDNYGLQYLKLFRERHGQEVFLEEGAGRLFKREAE